MCSIPSFKPGAALHDSSGEPQPYLSQEEALFLDAVEVEAEYKREVDGLLCDLEDVGLVLDRRRNKSSVTDLSGGSHFYQLQAGLRRISHEIRRSTAAEWCQQQHAFSLSVRLPKVRLCFLPYSAAAC